MNQSICGPAATPAGKNLPRRWIWHAGCTSSEVIGDHGPHPTAILKWGLRSSRSYGRLPLTRTAKTGRSCRVRGPTFFFSLRRSRVFAGRLLTLEGSVRYCAGFQEAGFSRSPSGIPAPSGQRSFNWQSTAFVMRGLWVRFPPLALGTGTAHRPQQDTGGPIRDGCHNPHRHP